MLGSVNTRMVCGLALLWQANSLVENVDLSLGGADANVVPVVEQFGFSRGGLLDVDLVTTPPEETVYVAMFSMEQWQDWYFRFRRSNKFQLCAVPSMARIEVNGQATISVEVKDFDQYTVQILYCRENQVQVQGHVTLRNLDPRASRASVGGPQQYTHLDVMYDGVSELYRLLAAAYIVLTVVWLMACVRARAATSALQGAFVLALGSKAAEVSFQLIHFTRMSESGEEGHADTTANELVDGLSSTAFLGVLLLSALGWTITRTALTPRETRISLGIFTLYVCIGAARAFCAGGTDSCGAYMLTEYVLRSLIMLGIIVAFNFNITHLRASLRTGTWTPHSARQYRKLSMYQSFRWAFLIYLLLPTGLLVLKITVLDWQYEWLVVSLQETIVFCIYAHIASCFRPSRLVTLRRGEDSNEDAEVVRGNGEQRHYYGFGVDDELSRVAAAIESGEPIGGSRTPRGFGDYHSEDATHSAVVRPVGRGDSRGSLHSNFVWRSLRRWHIGSHRPTLLRSSTSSSTDDDGVELMELSTSSGRSSPASQVLGQASVNS